LKELPWDEGEGDDVDGHKAVTRGSASTSDDRVERIAAVQEDEVVDVEASERTALLPSRSRSHSHSSLPRRDSSSHHQHYLSSHHHHHPHSQTLRQFISTPSFWLFGALILLSTGPVEMYMASLGQILESLSAVSTNLPFRSTASHALQSRKDHISVLAIGNTVSRLGVGAISDFLSTAAATREEGGSGRKRITRLWFLLGACASLSIAYAWGGLGLTSEKGLWIITISELLLRLSRSLRSNLSSQFRQIVNGTSYGSVFTLSPAIVRSYWPVEHFGRNWGLLTFVCSSSTHVRALTNARSYLHSWFSAIGALIFTPLFGILRDLASSPSSLLSLTQVSPICASTECYRPIFLVCAVSAAASCGVVGLLWRRWSAIV